MKKGMTKAMRSMCATAMALTLAIPASAGMKANVVEAASGSVLSRAKVTYDFNSGTKTLELEGEQKLHLKDSGEEDASGNAIMLPVVENGEYKKDTSTALPTVVMDDEMGNVLRFKSSEKVDKYVKTASDELDKEYPIGTYLQTPERIGGRVHLENPYKGMKFNNTDGVTISYWVKAPTVKNEEDPASNHKGGKMVGANSTTVVFNNASREVMQKDDYMKYLVCNAYDKIAEDPEHKPVVIANGDTVKWEDFSMGTQKLVTTPNKSNTYILYENYGKLIRFNPNYPLESIEVNGEQVKPTQIGGWYAPEKESEQVVSVLDSNNKSYRIASLATGTQLDSNQYKLYRYKYAPLGVTGDAATGEAAETAEKELNANGYSSKSKIRQGIIQGSMQITTDNDFGFREDSYRTESYMAPVLDDNGNQVIENGVPKTELKLRPIAGAKVNNPNSDRHGQLQDFYGSNQLYFDGDEFVTQGKEEDTIYDENLSDDDIDRPAIEGADNWHYVTIVIKNDWVQTYVDGVPASTEGDVSDYQYLKDNISVEATGNHDFGAKDKNVGKTFNRGKGLRTPYELPKSNIADWTSYGTASSMPGNTVAPTMLEWLTDENTELYLGGTGFSSEMLTQGYGTVDGVCMDDVSFFTEALDMADAVALYEEMKEFKENEDHDAVDDTNYDVDGNGTVELKDAQLALRDCLRIEKLTEEQFAVADLDGNKNIEMGEVFRILRAALKKN